MAKVSDYYKKRLQKRLRKNPIYITFDLDCLDPTIAPGVSNLEPGAMGFNIDEAIEIIQSTRNLNVIGGDIVCMMPTKDSPKQITEHTDSKITHS